jgi:hypothetical protein
MKAPTEKELEKIPEENFMAWLYSEYGHDCDGISYFMVGEDAENGFIEFDTFCSGLNQTYCDVSPKQYKKIKKGYYNGKHPIMKVRYDRKSLPKDGEVVMFHLHTDQSHANWHKGKYWKDAEEFVITKQIYYSTSEVAEWKSTNKL